MKKYRLTALAAPRSKTAAVKKARNKERHTTILGDGRDTTERPRPQAEGCQQNRHEFPILRILRPNIMGFDSAIFFVQNNKTLFYIQPKYNKY